MHNHLFGDTKPSPEDKKITMKVGISLMSIDVHLHDHIIIGDGYYSMADEGDIHKIKVRMGEFMLA